jgi:hypothetical protein
MKIGGSFSMWCSGRGVVKILFRFIVLAGISSALMGCGKDQTWWRDLVDQCNVPSDQKGSFMAPPQNSQMRLVVDSELGNNPEHGSDWMDSIQRAAQKWNDFGNQKRGAGFFSIEQGDVPSDVRTGHFADCQLGDAGTENHFYLMLEKDPDHWSQAGFNDSVPGATVRCYSDDNLTSQVIMVRPDLVKPEQFMSVVLHEMGHSLGLDHSCKPGGGDNYAACESIENDPHHPYYLAVMYPQLVADPTIRSGAPIKEDLQENDMSRAGCFY